VGKDVLYGRYHAYEEHPVDNNGLGLTIDMGCLGGSLYSGKTGMKTSTNV
jgi:hypothetical protein